MKKKKRFIVSGTIQANNRVAVLINNIVNFVTSQPFLIVKIISLFLTPSTSIINKNKFFELLKR